MAAEQKDAYPLSWPDDWVRTRPQDRRPMTAWKKTANYYRDRLITELTRMGSETAIISTNVPVNLRNTLTNTGVDPLDVGVAVYFSRKAKDDFAWQDALGIHDPAPTEAQIQDAFRRLAQVYHPDRGGDVSMFQMLAKHRDAALRWVRRKSHQQFDYVIACDQFTEVRLNMAAIYLTIKAIRQIERCGTSTLLERAFKGFAALPAAGEAATVGAVQ